jgi:hypothetical protein
MRSIPIYAAAVTPSDTKGLDQAAVIYVGGAGNVACLPEGNTAAVTFVGLSAGDILPVSVVRVNATNTTATSLVALW